MRYITLLLIALCSLNAVLAQCNNTLYAMGYNGVIYSVNPTTAALTAVNSTAAPNANTSNAIAYAGGTTPTFYFFANSKSGSLIFESYVPSTNTFTKLSLAGGPVDTVNAACVAPNYKGYYCLDIHGHIYYYDFASGTWTTITTVIKDQTGTDITSTVATYSSGDLAFDGNGNLWMLLADKATSRFGLYEIYANLPTTPVSSLTAHQVVALGAKMPDGYDPVGIAFNALGQMYISTLNLSSFACDLYLWNSPATLPILVHSMSQVILDLSSCSLPFGVLPVNFEKITASLTAQRTVTVCWQVNHQAEVKAYTVERSSDQTNWESLTVIPANSESTAYCFVDDHPSYGTNYYRIVETEVDGQFFSSNIVSVQFKSAPAMRLWPNPAHDLLFVENPGSSSLTVEVFDVSGRMMMTKMLQPGVNSIPVNALAHGLYVLRPIDPKAAKPITFLKASN